MEVAELFVRVIFTGSSSMKCIGESAFKIELPPGVAELSDISG